MAAPAAPRSPPPLRRPLSTLGAAHNNTDSITGVIATSTDNKDTTAPEACTYVPSSPVDLGLGSRSRRRANQPTQADIHGTFAASLRPDKPEGEGEDGVGGRSGGRSGSGKKTPSRRSRNGTPQASTSTTSTSAATPGSEESAIGYHMGYNMDAVHPSTHGGGTDSSATKKLQYETPQKHTHANVNANANAINSASRSGGSGSASRSRGGTPASRLSARKSAEKVVAAYSTPSKSKIPTGTSVTPPTATAVNASGGTRTGSGGGASSMAKRVSPNCATPSRIPLPSVSPIAASQLQPTGTETQSAAETEASDSSATVTATGADTDTKTEAEAEAEAALAPTPILLAAASPTLAPRQRLMLLKSKVKRNRSSSRSRGDAAGAESGAESGAGAGAGASMLRTVSAGAVGYGLSEVAGASVSEDAGAMLGSQSQADISVMDSNGNLILNGEYSGPGALKAPPRSAPVLRGRTGRRPRSRFASNTPSSQTQTQTPVPSQQAQHDNNCVFDPVTGEVRASHIQSLASSSSDDAEAVATASSCPPAAAVVASVGAIKKRHPRGATSLSTLDSTAPAPAPAPAPAFASVSNKDTSEHLVSFADAANMPGAYAPGTAPPVDGGGDTSAEAAVASTVTCPTCSRNFNATAAARHIKVCEQVFIVKPKKFDGSAKRIEKIAEENAAPEVAGYNAHNSGSRSGSLSRKSNSGSNGTSSVRSSQDSTSTSSTTTSASVKKSTWKQHSDQLRRAMNSMKKPKMLSAGAGEAAMDSMPPPANTPVNQSLDTTTAANTVVEAPVEDYLTPCPHCSRRFNERAAERHIPQCLDIKARPKTLKKNSGRPAVSKSKAPLKTTTAVSRML